MKSTRTLVDRLNDAGVDQGSAILFVADYDIVFKRVTKEILEKYDINLPADEVEEMIENS